MSSIQSDATFNAASLDRLGSQVSLDDLRRQSGPEVAAPDAGLADVAYGPQVDAGEDVLNVAAWEGTPAGHRQLAGDAAFEARLGQLDLSLAADTASDAILDALA
ncbi:hypothetical protein LDO26_12890 [Luteimonas sp. BDR2-5]|uniref:hypothetical protein n=1 Tax=Proluteimonas luteida TaxID=2878685 RepID=UPI001E5F0273|nr:hypothetical protein [Luteimonas sp. BDR2-5]MCD9029096.1 hypothetical protein [Luteimonas sp. BDR2-5]